MVKKSPQLIFSINLSNILKNEKRLMVAEKSESQRHTQVRFILMVLSIYAIINGYLFFTGWRAVTAFSGSRVLFGVVAGFFIVAYPLGRLLERRWPNIISDGLILSGSLYLGGMVYLLIAALTFDFLGILFRIIGISFPGSSQGTALLFYSTLTGIGVVLAYGYWHARQIRLTSRVIKLPFTIAENIPVIRIVIFSDIHLGTIVRKRELERIVTLANSLAPDIILIPGDVLDENLPPQRWKAMLQPLTQLRARWGVFGTTGNHEYFIDKHAAVAAIMQTGIRILEDEVVSPLPHLAIVGRKDVTGKYFGERRKPLAELIQGLPENTVLVVMDHQPVHLEEAVQAGVTLQVSGHTHDGQFWPINWINRKVWEISYGYRQKGETHFYVTSGVGAWGPPIRIGTHAEIVILDLKFSQKKGAPQPD